MKQIILIGLLLSIFLVGCQPAVIEMECPTCQCPIAKINITDNSLYVYFINVGQGDSELIKYNNMEMLIDCGNNGQGPTVVDFLQSKGIKELDYLMITHLESDHLGGCDDVLKSIPTKAVITNGQTSDTQSYKEVMQAIAYTPQQEQILIANEGNIWDLGPAKVEVIQALKEPNGENQDSIIAKLTYNQVSFLFTGDCDKGCETSLLSKNIDIDILKVAHHGSKYATSLGLLESTTPKIAVIEVGKDNAYGHPAPETLDRLSQEGILVYRTDLNGNIEIKTDGLIYEVK